MKIRPEKAEDKSKIATLIAKTYGAQGAKVIEVTSQLRLEDNFEREFSLVGEEEGEIVAFALFTRVFSEGKKTDYVIMAPLAFDTSKQVDVSSFLEEVYSYLKKFNVKAVFALGEEKSIGNKSFKCAEKLGFSLKGGKTPFVVNLFDEGVSPEELEFPKYLLD